MRAIRYAREHSIAVRPLPPRIAELGHDRDMNGYTYAGTPLQDRAGLQSSFLFGSAHRGGMHAVYADGSVHAILYEVGPHVWIKLGGRNDGHLTQDDLTPLPSPSPPRPRPPRPPRPTR